MPSTPINAITKQALIDNVATYPTPEGLLLSLMPAGLLPRLSAWLLDAAIKLIAFAIIGAIGAFFGNAGIGLMAIGYFLINWLYPVYFEVYRDGMTPGKKSKNIYVCHDDGTPVTLQASLIRNLLRVADFLPFAFVSGALAMLFNKKSQRIGDVVAGTIVVYRNDDDVATLFERVYGGVAHHADNLAAMSQPMSQPMPSSQLAAITSAPLFYYPLTLVEQQALLAFAERQPYLSRPRQIEIASALKPLVNLNSSLYGNSQDEQLLATLTTRIDSIRGYDPNAEPRLPTDLQADFAVNLGNPSADRLPNTGRAR